MCKEKSLSWAGPNHSQLIYFLPLSIGVIISLLYIHYIYMII